jgi:GcrA cell cycle regulator
MASESHTSSQTTWTTERIARLKRHIDDGMSCAQIAREIGLSRNAVIGKINRLGLSRLGSARSGQPQRTGGATVTRARRPLLSVLRAMPELALAEASAEGAGRCSLLELQQWHCRWPMGDPHAEGFGFCGNTPIAGLPYCAPHARRAYRPSTRQAGCAASS